MWLAVLARCFHLQDELAVLELDRVLDASPADLDGHRLALSVARQGRRKLILLKTKYLMNRMDAAAGIATSNVLLHATTSRAVVDSINHVGIAVDDFHGPLGIEFGRESLDAPRWWDAARDPRQLKNAGAEAGRIALVGSVGVGLTAASVVVAKIAAKKR
ncbi:hypothetical protein [Micromonospora aurantiaca (nom. illeg.)]|uniref:hypothetical protein n=1 Tax=Micromonospora aurantiaca (nom. illeg.) TaxID=47850 RepID=UPI0033D12953